MSKAKTVLPDVIKKSRNEALKGLGKRTKETTEETKDKRGLLPVGKSTAIKDSGKITNVKDIPKGMTTLEFFNQNG